MTVTVRLMADWGLYPFYINDEGTNDLVDPPEFQAYFGLPDHVMDELIAWNHIYQAILDMDDPGGSDWASRADELAFIERGREVSRLLRQHLPESVVIEYTGADNVASEYY